MTSTRFSYLNGLHCSACDKTYDPDAIQGLCVCGAPLLAVYDLPQLRADAPDPGFISNRVPDLWRYHELLPVRSPGNVVSLGEGMTPLVPLERLGAELGLNRVVLKDEGLLPTATFKARGAAVGISRAKEVGVRRISMPTNGNAGAAWATYAARAGLSAAISMPVDAPLVTRAECDITGAELFLMNGLIGDAGAALRPLASGGSESYFDVSTLKEPYRLEGKKTMGLELAEQFGWRLPDVILYPTGGGVGLIGMHKAFQELLELGWVQGKFPRLVAVQSDGCAPIVRAFEAGQPTVEPWADARTIAFGITVPNPLGGALMLQALKDSDGTAVAVSDEDLLVAQRRLAEVEGCFVCPEGAAAIHALGVLRRSGWLGDDESVVVLNTGAGIKYSDLVRVDAPVLSIGDVITPDMTSGPGRSGAARV